MYICHYRGFVAFFTFSITWKQHISTWREKYHMPICCEEVWLNHFRRTLQQLGKNRRRKKKKKQRTHEICILPVCQNFRLLWGSLPFPLFPSETRSQRRFSIVFRLMKKWWTKLWTFYLLLSRNTDWTLQAANLHLI